MSYFSDLIIKFNEDKNVLLSVRVNESYVKTFIIPKEEFANLIDVDSFENDKYKIKLNAIKNLTKLSIKTADLIHSFRISYNEWIKCCSLFKAGSGK